MTENTTAQQLTDLEWLLTPLLDVPEVTGALLAAQDGLKLAYTRRGSGPHPERGFDESTADRVASVISGMYALTNGLAHAFGGSAQGLELCAIKHEQWSVFVASAGQGVPETTPIGLGRRHADVECTLGVVTTRKADEVVIGHEMLQLILRMDRHLRTPARRPETGAARAQ
ncbi:roadblock/LC7 domain-containing protein [Streptomyces olivaceoviridis]|uniref:roadblock/LC7 domain-containing protein n=1 Tax=Streptomyces olivaceoviridis TaxID=1921 RepID=UPI0033254E7D